jgi:Tripartite tricarboxylate transporter family receptor
MITRAIVVVAALLVVCAPVPAQDFPTRVVRIIIPLGPGGGGDVFTRALANELQKAWGQPVVVENRPGGALIIGTRACAEAVADGHTICVLSSEGLRADRQPVLQHARARRQQFPQCEDHAGADRARKGAAGHAQLCHFFVSARVFHGEAQAGIRRRPGTGAVPQRQRGRHLRTSGSKAALES